MEASMTTSWATHDLREDVATRLHAPADASAWSNTTVERILGGRHIERA
jgi:hypothetical protein